MTTWAPSQEPGIRLRVQQALHVASGVSHASADIIVLENLVGVDGDSIGFTRASFNTGANGA